MHPSRISRSSAALQLTSRCSSDRLRNELHFSPRLLTRCSSSEMSRCSFGTGIAFKQASTPCYLQRICLLRSVATIDAPRKNRNKPQTRQFSALPRLPKTACPFRTLKIPKDSSYAHAKKSFLKIAMKHHPDTFSDEEDSPEKRQKSQEIFMRCRSALESLVECESTGLALLKSEVEEARTMSNEEFDSWFEEETGKQSPFALNIDPATMREVASMHEDMAGSHGLDRDGGMWHLASLISSTVKSGKEGAADLLKLEAGNVGEVEAKGKLERRRRRARGRR